MATNQSKHQYMKTTILLLITGLTIFEAGAQTKFAISAGPNLGGLITKVNGSKDEGIKNDLGYIISGELFLPLGTMYKLQTGLQFESVHSKVNENTTSVSGSFTSNNVFKAKTQLDYINIPLKFLFDLSKGKAHLMIGAGAYLGIAVSGKTKSTETVTVTNGTTTQKTEFNYSAKATFGSADTSVKRFNSGIDLSVAYVFPRNFFITLYNHIGLVNINNQSRYNTKVSSVGLTLGYFFPARKEN